MRNVLLLAAVLACIMLPPALALNCTLYEGARGELCGVVNPLSLNEDEKTSLMQDNVYGSMDTTQIPITLNLSLPNTEQVMLNDVYERNIEPPRKTLPFLAVHYGAYSLTTRSSILIQWLNVGS